MGRTQTAATRLAAPLMKSAGLTSKVGGAAIMPKRSLRSCPVNGQEVAGPEPCERLRVVQRLEAPREPQRGSGDVTRHERHGEVVIAITGGLETRPPTGCLERRGMVRLEMNLFSEGSRGVAAPGQHARYRSPQPNPELEQGRPVRDLDDGCA